MVTKESIDWTSLITTEVSVLKATALRNFVVSSLRTIQFLSLREKKTEVLCLVHGFSRMTMHGRGSLSKSGKANFFKKTFPFARRTRPMPSACQWARQVDKGLSFPLHHVHMHSCWCWRTCMGCEAYSSVVCWPFLQNYMSKVHCVCQFLPAGLSRAARCRTQGLFTPETNWNSSRIEQTNCHWNV